jgi:hypothetical protein
MQREDLFLKQLHQFMRFLQKWLQKNDLSKVEINELEAEGISKEFLEIFCFFSHYSKQKKNSEKISKYY